MKQLSMIIQEAQCKIQLITKRTHIVYMVIIYNNAITIYLRKWKF